MYYWSCSLPECCINHNVNATSFPKGADCVYSVGSRDRQSVCLPDSLYLLSLSLLVPFFTGCLESILYALSGQHYHFVPAK